MKPDHPPIGGDRMRAVRSILMPGLLALAFVAALDAAPQLPPGIEELHRLDQLPRFKEPRFIGAVTSYDRSGGNDDGFSGKYSFVRKEASGLVIADLAGPGVLYRIWTPTPTSDPIAFYFDGETSPRIELPFRELFSGTRPPFVSPLVGSGAGGHYSYVPIPYRRSLKIVIRSQKVQFYQINYATYPESAGIGSWDSGDYLRKRQAFETARALWSSAGRTAGMDLPRFTAPPGAEVRSQKVTKTLAPNETLSLFELREPGRILGLRLRPASAFAGKDRSIVLRIFWDDAPTPAVEAPAGDLFGYSFGQPAVRSLLFGTLADTNYLYWPMPFDRSARVELVNQGADTPAREIEAELVFAPVPRMDDEGRFYAFWHRENPTTLGRPFTFLEARGRGHVVATILQAQGDEPGGTGFFEGDDQTLIDGELVVHGTGSEDFFNGGWYDVPGRWDRRTSLPMSGCLDYKKHFGRTGGYRLFLGDAYPYRERIRLTIEHAPTENDQLTDYTSVTYFYAAAPPKELPPLAPLAERRVADFERTVFNPGWNVPIDSFSLRDATLSKRQEELGGEHLRFLSMTAAGQDIFGPHQIGFVLEAPAPGRYRVLVEGIAGPSRGELQLYRNEQALGEPVDFFASARRKTKPLLLGETDLSEGANVLFFRLVGKHPLSKGLGMDIATIILERSR